ncbi:LysR substrate-binding domain-containing protein [Achromobacter sp.]|uniref:LysR substrate-binding domain-containing protein n=1 Tax=Achromobacter sp. TaxID=134375 RepID=UPI0028A63069|nr:LysR substrate-binding domain-containing protein [Achromobacter sp.]
MDTERRHFRLGIASHMAGPETPTLLARLHERDPALSIEVRLDNSHALLDAFDNGDLEAVIVGQEDDRRDGKDLGPEHFGWFAAPGFEWRAGDPLRMATLMPCCQVRNTAIQALDRNDIAWKEVFVGGGYAVMAAVSAGLAIGALACRLAPADTIEVGERFSLPALPPSRVMLHSTLTDPRSRDALRTIAAAYREHRSVRQATPQG